MCLPSTPHILSNTTSAESVKWGLNLSRLITKLKTNIQEKDLSNSTNMNQSPCFKNRILQRYTPCALFNPNRSLEPKHILFYYRADCLAL